MISYYVLKDRVPVPARLAECERMLGEAGACAVASDTIGPFWVSTVFLCIDHSVAEKGPPLLFETMIFDGGAAQYQGRCSTWAEAEAMHDRAVQEARKRRKPL